MTALTGGLVLIAGLVVAAGVSVVAWKRPAVAMGLYAFSIPFGSSFALPAGIPPPFNTATTLLGGLTGGVLLLRMISRRRVNPSVPISVYILSIFVALSGVTYAWSIEPGTSARELWILLSLLALHVAAAHYLFDRGDLRSIEAGVAAGGAVTGLFAIYLLAVGQMPTTGAGVPRFEVTGAGGGEGGDPNITAAALLLPYAVALYRALSPDRPWIRTSYLLATISTGLGILLTASRGGILATTVATVVVLASSAYRKVGAAVIVVALIGSFLVLPATMTERVDNTGTSGRTDIWRVGLLACTTYCPLGSGLGTFADVHEDFFLREAEAGGNQIRYQAHNIWLQVAVETGVVTLAVFTVAMGLVHLETSRISRSRRGGALGALWSVLLANFFLSSLSFKYFWLTLTYAAIVVTIERSEDRHPMRLETESPSPTTDSTSVRETAPSPA